MTVRPAGALVDGLRRRRQRRRCGCSTPRPWTCWRSSRCPPRKPSATPVLDLRGWRLLLPRPPRPRGRADLGRPRSTSSPDRRHRRRTGFELVQDVRRLRGVGDSVILSALPDWGGRVWFVTAGRRGRLVNRRTGAVRSDSDLGETIGNSFAVDETGGGVHRLRRRALPVRRGPQGRPARDLAQDVRRRHPRRSPGRRSRAPAPRRRSSTRGRPTYVAITDNADPRMHVLVFRRRRGGPGRAPVCRIPVFAKRPGRDRQLA